jgi:hypothetical protein
LWALLAADMIDRDVLAADVPNPIPFPFLVDERAGIDYRQKQNKSLYLSNIGAAAVHDYYINTNPLFDNHQVTDYPAAMYVYTGGTWWLYYNERNAKCDSGNYHVPSFQKAGLETEMYRYPWVPEMSNVHANFNFGILPGEGPPEFGAGTTNRRFTSTYYGDNYRNFARYIHPVGNPYTQGFFNGWVDETYEESGEWIMKIKSIKPVFGPEPEWSLE